MKNLLELRWLACAGCPRSANTAAGIGTPEIQLKIRLS
jgi:hypothetical protein